MRKFRLLTADEIEVKVKQVREKGAVALIYKTSRVDMDILDETVGAENWQSEFKEIKGNLYCGIGIRDTETKEWTWKWDCGIESRADGEGNEKKGEASDAFKRAGVQWGIGRELYTSPFIFLPVPTKQDGKMYKLSNPFEKFSVSHIAYDESGRIAEIAITGENGKEWYRYPKSVKSSNTARAEPKFKPITVKELKEFYGVSNPSATIAGLEKKMGVPLAEWDEDVTNKARAWLEGRKKTRERTEKLKAETESVSAPFSIADETA